MNEDNPSNLLKLVSDKRYDYYVTHKAHELEADSWKKTHIATTFFLILGAVISLGFATDLALTRIPLAPATKVWVLIGSTSLLTLSGLYDLIRSPQERSRNYHNSANRVLETRNRVESLYAVLLDEQIDPSTARAELDEINKVFEGISATSERTGAKAHKKAKKLVVSSQPDFTA